MTTPRRRLRYVAQSHENLEDHDPLEDGPQSTALVAERVGRLWVQIRPHQIAPAQNGNMEEQACICVEELSLRLSWMSRASYHTTAIHILIGHSDQGWVREGFVWVRQNQSVGSLYLD